MEQFLTLLFTSLVVPFLTAFFNKENWTGGKKFGISLLVTIVFGGVIQFGAIKAGWQIHDGNAVLGALGLIFTGAQGFYRVFPNAITHVEKNVNGVKDSD